MLEGNQIRLGEENYLNEEAAWEDYNRLFSKLELELLALINHHNHLVKKENAHVVSKIETAILENPVEGTSIARIISHVMKGLALDYAEGREHTNLAVDRVFSHRRVAKAGAESEHVLGIESDTGAPLVLKIIKKHADDFAKKLFKNEQDVLERLAEFYQKEYPPNLLKLYARGDGVTATERVQNSINLNSLMKSKKNSLSDVITWINGIVSGLEALYEAGYESHGDVKPANGLVSTYEVYLCDFSMVRKNPVFPDEEYYAGTAQYMSPESWLLYRHPRKNDGMVLLEEIDKKSDVFSLGVTVYQFLTLGRDPFCREDILSNIKTLEYPANVLVAALAEQMANEDISFPSIDRLAQGHEFSLEEMAKRYAYKDLSSENCSFFSNENIFKELNKLIKSCFDLDRSKRPKSPSDFLEKLVSILTKHSEIT